MFLGGVLGGVLVSFWCIFGVLGGILVSFWCFYVFFACFWFLMKKVRKSAVFRTRTFKVLQDSFCSKSTKMREKSVTIFRSIFGCHF